MLKLRVLEHRRRSKLWPQLLSRDGRDNTVDGGRLVVKNKTGDIKMESCRQEVRLECETVVRVRLANDVTGLKYLDIIEATSSDGSKCLLVINETGCASINQYGSCYPIN